MRVLLFVICCFQLSAAAIDWCPPDQAGAVRAIEALPEAQGLLDTVEREGGARVIAQPGGDFEAFWRGWERTIVINSHYNPSEGRLISSIVFELCNAAANNQLQSLWQRAAHGSISEKDFVRGVEQIEYSNLKRARAILLAGISRGLFPPSASLQAPSSFESYFETQKACGHSAFLARQYRRTRRWA